MDFLALLNTVTAALLLGAGKLLLDVKTTCAVHEERLDTHHERLKGLEDRPSCTHNR